MKTYWVCMAGAWSVPPVKCDERGEGHTAPQKHTEATGHPTMQTVVAAAADRLAASRL